MILSPFPEKKSDLDLSLFLQKGELFFAPKLEAVKQPTGLFSEGHNYWIVRPHLQSLLLAGARLRVGGQG